MDSITDVKEALTAKSRVASLDELKGRGRKTVKVIRAEHIAEMMQEAVTKAVSGSGLMSRDEVDELVSRGQEEFRGVIREHGSLFRRFRRFMTRTYA